VRNDARANALDEQTAARAEFEPLRAKSSLAPLVPSLQRFYHSEHTATKTAQAAIEDQQIVAIAAVVTGGLGLDALINRCC